MTTAGVTARVVGAKYIDHQPTYRREAIILGAAGSAVPSPTKAEWIDAIAAELVPLMQAMSPNQLGRHVLYADVTPVALLKPCHGKINAPTCGVLHRRRG